MEITDSMQEKYNNGVEIYNEACQGIVTGLGKAEFNQSIDERIKGAESSIRKYESARKDLKAAKTKWIALHRSCLGEDADNAYDSYSNVYDLVKKSY